MSKPPKVKREIPAEGNYKGTLVHIIDLGTQVNKNPAFADAPKVHLGYELAGRKRKDGQPFVVSTKFTFSSSPKSNMAKTLKKWLGVKNPAEYDLVDALKKDANLVIEHSEDGQYANITEINKYSGPKLRPETKPISLFLDDTFEQDVFDKLWDKIKETIALSPEYDEVVGKSRKKGKKK